LGAEPGPGPDATVGEAVDNCLIGVQQMHPEPERGATNAPTGCNRRGDGVQRLHRNHGNIREPSAASARGCAALPAADGPSSRLAGMFFCALGPVWRLTGLPPGRAW